MEVNKIYLWLLGATLALAAIFFIAIPFYFARHAGYAPIQSLQDAQPIATSTCAQCGSQVYDSTQTNVQNSDMPASLVVVYTTLASTTMDTGRLWETRNVWRKVGSGAPELVATVGGVGEEPVGFMLSPDKNYLAVNLEKAVDIIDLQTKEKRRVFANAQWVIGSAFSTDDSKLLVADGASYVEHPVLRLMSIDLASGAARQLNPVQPANPYGDVSPLLWRADNKLIYVPVSYKDCGGGTAVLDLTTLVSTSTFSEYNFSRDGMAAIGASRESIPSGTDGMCDPGFYPTVVSVVEPASGTVLGRVGRSGEPFTFVSFSPDDKQVLFKTSTDQATYKFYLQDISETSVAQPLADPYALLAAWHADAGPVEYYKYSDKMQDANTLYVNNKPILKASSMPNIIAQYFR